MCASPIFFTSPLYIVSYVISNDAALQIYELELAQNGAGLACLESNLATMTPGFLAFLKEAELESPFAKERLVSVRQLLERHLMP